MTAYPAGLPVPLIADYQAVVSSGVSAVAFEHGNTRQRRSVRKERHVFTLSLVLSTSELWTWQSWANTYGYDWHYLNLTSNFSGLAGECAIPHYVRYTGDISIRHLGGDYVMVSFQAEMQVNSLPQGVIVPSGDIIVGGTPASPSNSNDVQAGTPASPSADFIIAGSPGFTA